VLESENPVSAYLRYEVDAIAQAWGVAVLQRLPHLRKLERGALIDHLPELLLGLATWIDGDKTRARQGLDALAEGHALQRLGHGVSLETLCIEYQVLRSVIFEQLLVLESSKHLRSTLVLLGEGLDHAVTEAIRRYTMQREQVRERFVGILGHDLRNPLSAIVLAATHVAAVPCSEPKHAQLGATIQRSANRMLRLIADVIDFTQAHMGDGIPAVPKLCDMGEICEEAAQELRVGHPDRRISVDLHGDLRGHWDRDRVIQAISNLIGNAIEHGRDPIEVGAEVRADQQAVITRISNHGPTIPPQELARVFDPFHRGHDDHRRNGLGLGLYIVQQIALAHGASATVTSRDGLTTFELCWPRVPIERMPDRA